MDGVLVIDKPGGLTSHDAVAAARRALGERRIGHTGTLDPMATGVLPLACGRATRLVRFLAASTKAYRASVRFGVTTDTYDATGEETSRTDRRPSADAVARALERLRGEQQQVPPPFSAKKVAGERAYVRARARQPVALAPVRVHVSKVELLAFDGDTAEIALTCSAGFYVRSFVHDLGAMVGTGACLSALRRTRSGEFTLEQAMPLETVVADPGRAAAQLIPVDRLLPWMASARVTAEGRRRVSHGQPLYAAHLIAPPEPKPSDVAGGAWTRLLDEQGCLIALATTAHDGDVLHPSVVLI